jgi:hypothetical protein
MVTTSPAPDSRTGQMVGDTQDGSAGAGPNFPDDQCSIDTQVEDVAGGSNLLTGQISRDSDFQASSAGEHPTPQSTNRVPSPIPGASTGNLSSGDQVEVGTQNGHVAAPLPPEPASESASPNAVTPVLADPLLALAADVLDDIETVRIANENRLRQLTRVGLDKDGKERGFGLTIEHPDVARLAAIVAGFLCTSDVVLELGIPKGPRRSLGCCLEHDAERNLHQKIKLHPLNPWMRAQKGIGEKQGARLLAAIGDPYIRPEMTYSDGRVEPSRPRKISELHAYCGVHVVDVVTDYRPDFPGGQYESDTQRSSATGEPTSASQAVTDNTQPPSAGGTQPPTGQMSPGVATSARDTHVISAGGDLTGSDPDLAGRDNHSTHVGVAASRARGQRMNWNPTARMRVILVADKIIQVGKGGHYRDLYDQGRIKYADAIHRGTCKRCGPSGKPAAQGSPLSDGHKHARARRLVARAVLKDLRREARRIHLSAAE